MPNRYIQTLYDKAIRESATKEGQEKMKNQAVEDVLTEGGLV